MDTIRNFHRLIIDSSRDDLFSVVDYLIDEFDLTVFWKGIEADGAIPDSVKLFVDSDTADEPDLVGNPMSWHICSNKLLEYWLPMIENDIQLFEAPLYEKKTDQKMSGFKILNPLRRFEALDLSKSKFIGNKNRIKTVSKFVFEEQKIPKNVHMFRPLEFLKAVIVSDELVKEIVGIGVKGLAFVKCDSI